ncbi:MAG: hypothetical protein ACREDR_12485 [Blastocatellia bacterium]
MPNIRRRVVGVGEVAIGNNRIGRIGEAASCPEGEGPGDSAYLPDFELGTAACHTEPRGEHGLEGYQRGEGYAARRYGSAEGGRFAYRLRPSPDQDYWESCSQRVFNRYFRWLEASRSESSGERDVWRN